MASPRKRTLRYNHTYFDDILLHFVCVFEKRIYFTNHKKKNKLLKAQNNFLDGYLLNISFRSLLKVSLNVQWMFFYQLKYSLLQDRAEPHHFVSTNGGHRRPPRRACFITSLRRCISPIPQDLLHALHDDHSVTRQSRGGPKHSQQT